MLGIAFDAVADLVEVLDAALEHRVLLDEGTVDLLVLDEQVQDSIGQREVAARTHLDVHVGVVRGRRAARRDVDDAHLGVPALVLEDPAEEHRVHLGHVVPPQDEVVSQFEVVVAPHGLVALELGHETHRRAGHAEARVGIQVVATQPALDPFQCGVAVVNGPLARTVHAHGFGTVVLQRGRITLGDQVEGLVPGDHLE